MIHKPLIWRCDFDHEEETFEVVEEFNKHLGTQHADYNEAEREAMSRSCRYPRRRRLHTCPVCGYDVASPRPSMSESLSKTGSVPKATKADEHELLHSLAKHIAAHLRILAVKSSENVGPESDVRSERTLNTMIPSTRHGSKVVPASFAKDLSDVLLENFDVVQDLDTSEYVYENNGSLETIPKLDKFANLILEIPAEDCFE